MTVKPTVEYYLDPSWAIGASEDVLGHLGLQAPLRNVEPVWMMIFVMITEQFLQFGNSILPGEAMNVFPIIKCYLEEKTESALKWVL